MTKPGDSTNKRAAADRRELQRAKRSAASAVNSVSRVLRDPGASNRSIASAARRAARETGRLWDAAARLIPE